MCRFAARHHRWCDDGDTVLLFESQVPTKLRMLPWSLWPSSSRQLRVQAKPGLVRVGYDSHSQQISEMPATLWEHASLSLWKGSWSCLCKNVKKNTCKSVFTTSHSPIRIVSFVTQFCSSQKIQAPPWSRRIARVYVAPMDGILQQYLDFRHPRFGPNFSWIPGYQCTQPAPRNNRPS